MAVRAKRGGQWLDLSYPELADRVQDLSLGLLELGIRPGDRVAILSENRPEWAIADYACLAARCTDVPIYPTLPAKQVEYNLCDSGAVAVFVSTRHQLDKVLAASGSGCPRSGTSSPSKTMRAGPDVLSLDAGDTPRGRARPRRHPAGRPMRSQVQPDDLATLIYTSGTTGEMKGVMLTHGNIASNVIHLLPALQLQRRTTSACPSCRSPTSSSGCSVTTACFTRA